MSSVIDGIMVALVLTNLFLLGSGSLTANIRVVALQGFLLGPLPVLAHPGELMPADLLMVALIVGLKGFLFPYLLMRAMREAQVRREVEPFIGPVASLLMGIAAFIVSFRLGASLPPVQEPASQLVMPVAFFTIMVGLLVIVSRRKALTQALGYLTMENGIFAFGIGLALKERLLVQLGVLLDLFLAVFVMGIAIYHINREFDHIDTDQLDYLKG